MIILPPNTMSDADIKLLRDNDLCVIVSKDPAKLRFLDSIPSAAGRGKVEQAAISLSRILLNGTWNNYTSQTMVGKDDIARIYVDLLIKGTELDTRGSIQQQEQEFFSAEKLLELRRLAKEEAKAQRAAAKAAKEKGKA